MRLIFSQSIILLLLTGCCEQITYTTIENTIQRQYYTQCLRLNKIEFSLKDDGIIIIIGKQANDAYEKIHNVVYEASAKSNLKICTPSTILEK